MRIQHHGDIENIWLYLTELEGTFDLWDDPFGGPPEPTPLQWRIDQTRVIESVPNWQFVDRYFKLRWSINAAKTSYAIGVDKLREFNLSRSMNTRIKMQVDSLRRDIVELKRELADVERDSRFVNALNKINELRHQGKLLKFSEWMRT